MEVLALDFKKVKESFVLEYDKEKNLIQGEMEFIIQGDTGASFDIKAKIEGMVPPESDTNHFLVHRYDFYGRGVKKYFDVCKSHLRRFKLPEKDIYFSHLHEKKLVGIYEDEEHRLNPVYYEFEHIDDEPIIREKRDKKEYLYFRINEKYYKIELNQDPLKLMVSSNMKFDHKEIEEVNKKVPFLTNKPDSVPFERKKYYLNHSLKYVGNRLRFNGDYKPEPDHYYGYVGRKNVSRKDGRIVICEDSRHSSYSSHLLTFEEFCYVNESKHPNIRSLIYITDEKVAGKPLPRYIVGDRVKVTNPRSKQKPIEGFEGVVVNDWGWRAKVKVKFFDYFEADISPLELTLIERKEEKKDEAI